MRICTGMNHKAVIKKVIKVGKVGGIYDDACLQHLQSAKRTRAQTYKPLRAH